MATKETVAKIKTDLRISHTALDADLSDTIDACLEDLVICGIHEPDETDKTTLAIVKLYYQANYTDNTDKAAANLKRHDSTKACLMMAAGYGGVPDE